MKPINNLPPFKRFCVTIGNLPSSYVDSMSYYECLMWLCKYLKDTVIPAVNENAEAVNELINWFNNLDVTEEVNNKLDEMVEDGTLEDIINNHIFVDLNDKISANTSNINTVNLKYQNITDTLNNKVEENTTAINVINDSIANIHDTTPIPVSSTSAMVDTTKVYLLTTSGYWYYYNGENFVAGGLYQSAGIEYNSLGVDKMLTSLQSDNLFNADTITDGKIINNTNGELVTNASYYVSDFIKVKAGVTYYTNFVRQVGYYDNSKTFIEMNDVTPISQLYTIVPDTDGYIRTTYKNDSKGMIFVSKINHLTDTYSVKGHVENTVDLKFLDKHKNKIDLSTVTYFYATNGNGTPYFSPDYCYGMVKIPSPCRLYLAYLRNYQLIKADGTTVVSAASDNITSLTYVDIESTQVQYIKFSAYRYNISKAYISYEDTSGSDSLITGKYLPSDLKVTDNNIITKLFGKTMYVFGDSLLYGHTSRITTIDTLGKKLKYEFTKYCYGGATVVNNGTNDIITQITNASDIEPEYILFNGGINDAYDTTTIGSVTSEYDSNLDLTTFCGCFENICRSIMNKYPSSRAFYITAHKTPSRDLTVQTEIHDKAVEICNKYSIPVIDIFKEGNLNCFNTTMRSLYTYDTLDNNNPTSGGVGGNGTHPNTLGYELFYDPIIERYLI